MKLESIVIVRRAALILAGVVASATLGGCMTSTPIWDAHFGEAVRTSAQVQVIDPHAGDHAPSPQSIDGTAAASAMDQYDKSFTAPPVTTNAFTIGISAGGGGGSASGQ
ncbi:hypothetical protein [Paraburkholderia pallida]|uniref:Lipoprotein n=1 Tax=Paraburkholderia pallida TaxID=2547399 RepID=A0A4V1AZ77_9BURK|nr:hypothetical protein [Paraburkholderia pallida]QBQ98312.1 hypothetical protein E1956_14790 [Paraburkholderia pallida]